MQSSRRTSSLHSSTQHTERDLRPYWHLTLFYDHNSGQNGGAVPHLLLVPSSMPGIEEHNLLEHCLSPLVRMHMVGVL